MGKHDVYRFFSKGPFGICPDCGEETFIRTGSLLGDKAQEQVVLPERVLDRILDDIFDWVRRCIECKSQAEPALYWIELSPGVIGGPLCEAHFKDEVAHSLGGDDGSFGNDAACYQIHFNKDTRAALDSFEFEEEEEPPDRELLDPSVLF